MIKICNLNKAHEKPILIGIVEPMGDITETHGECRSCIEIKLREDGLSESEVKESMDKYDRRRFS